LASAAFSKKADAILSLLSLGIAPCPTWRSVSTSPYNSSVVVVSFLRAPAFSARPS
jgi:hypothetical protein